jgi:hypothetical protein
MKKFLAVVIMILLAGCSSQPVVPGLIDWESRGDDRAEKVVRAFVDGEYATVRDNFNAAMKSALNLRKLKQAWEETVREAGGFIAVADIETLPPEEHDIYFVTTHHENKAIVTQIVFDAESGLITGLFFRFKD